MSNWTAFNFGKTIGAINEGGVILFDEEHPDLARITLKRNKNFISVSLNIYGWMDHTRFFNSDADAQREYRAMRSSIHSVLDLINSNAKDIKIWEAISEFVRRFP
ncbi:MAG: hypothetical protein JNM46_02570 [Anaerolineales bacterium]|nr:hypothetical protein [Anaerolineales bacterium]